MRTKPIIIDLEVSRIIETFRLSFQETENDILKRVLSNRLENFSNIIPEEVESTKSVSTSLLKNNSEKADFFISSPKHKKDVEALAKNSAHGFIVFKGSRVSKEITPKMPIYYRKLRAQLFADGIIDKQSREFTRDYEFTSPSASSSVILGVSSDGHRDWQYKIHSTPTTFKLKL